jgi:tetratricopeptide (TPR) repeat protein
MKKKIVVICLFLSFLSYSQKAIELNNIAMKKYNQKDYKGAILYLNKATIEDSKFAIAYYNRGLAYYRLEQYQKAINDYDIALKLNSKFTVVYCDRGNAKDALNNYAEAIKDYNKYIEFNPKNAGVYNDRGFAKSQLQDYRNAIIDLNRAIILNPNYAIAYYNRGTSKYKLGQKGDGCEDFRKASSLGFSVADKTIANFCHDNDIVKNTDSNFQTNTIIREKHIRAGEVFGFFSGIEITLDVISNQYPDLNYDINRIRLLQSTNFGLCKKNAINYLKEFNDWPDLEKKMEKTVKELTNTIETNIIFSLKEESQKYLIEIEKKLKGNIESPILENILAFQYQDFPHKEFTSGFTNKYSTKDHSKSKNAEWQLKVPKSWIAKEGDGPNIIQKFVNECGNGFNMISILTQDLPTEELVNNLNPKEIEEFYINDFFTEKNIKEFLPDNATFLSFKPMKIANCPGGLLIYELISERLGNKLKMRNYQFIFQNSSYLHFLNCSIGTDSISEDLSVKEKLIFPLYQMVANSIMITKKSETIIYLKGNSNQKIINVEINHKNYDFILDTGASMSLINKSLINELIRNKIILLENFLGKDFAELANGKKIEIEIWKIPTLKIGDKIIKNVDFSVINDNNVTPLLGMNILEKLDIWKIDLENNKIYLLD